MAGREGGVVVDAGNRVGDGADGEIEGVMQVGERAEEMTRAY